MYTAGTCSVVDSTLKAKKPSVCSWCHEGQYTQSTVPRHAICLSRCVYTGRHNSVLEHIGQGKSSRSHLFQSPHPWSVMHCPDDLRDPGLRTFYAEHIYSPGTSERRVVLYNSTHTNLLTYLLRVTDTYISESVERTLGRTWTCTNRRTFIHCDKKRHCTTLHFQHVISKNRRTTSEWVSEWVVS